VAFYVVALVVALLTIRPSGVSERADDETYAGD
jgi:hypothetical protein